MYQFQESFACPPCLRLFIHSITGAKGQRDPLALLNSECMLRQPSKTREEVFLFPCAVRGGRALSHGDNCIWPLNPLLRIIMNYHGVLVVKFKHAIAVQQEAKLFCSHTRRKTSQNSVNPNPNLTFIKILSLTLYDKRRRKLG